eukprot:GHVL01039864.1.p1 GENE.GHVL01039864.1~~GHVL01039864.1.p1  ORF type:complete len:379 (+),score=86.00 GHVL01039864.1:286-1422(+)
MLIKEQYLLLYLDSKCKKEYVYEKLYQKDFINWLCIYIKIERNDIIRNYDIVEYFVEKYTILYENRYIISDIQLDKNTYIILSTCIKLLISIIDISYKFLFSNKKTDWRNVTDVLLNDELNKCISKIERASDMSVTHFELLDPSQKEPLQALEARLGYRLTETILKYLGKSLSLLADISAIFKNSKNEMVDLTDFEKSNRLTDCDYWRSLSLTVFRFALKIKNLFETQATNDMSQLPPDSPYTVFDTTCFSGTGRAQANIILLLERQSLELARSGRTEEALAALDETVQILIRKHGDDLSSPWVTDQICHLLEICAGLNREIRHSGDELSARRTIFRLFLKNYGKDHELTVSAKRKYNNRCLEITGHPSLSLIKKAAK